MSMFQNIKIGIFIVCLINFDVVAWAPTNFFSPYSSTMRLPPVSQKISPKGLEIGTNFEYGRSNICRNIDGKKTNVLKLYEASQSTLAALEQPTEAIRTINFLTVFNQLEILGVRDDGIRGHVSFDGKFKQYDVTPHFLYNLPCNLLPGDLSIGVGLPIRRISVYDITFKDQTNQALLSPQEDLETRRLLTDNLKETAKNLGGLDLGEWAATGAGDLTITLDWTKGYVPKIKNLESVELSAFFGVSVPMGGLKDEDKVFSMPFGSDGAWGLPLGLGIDLDFTSHIALGASTQLKVLFDTTKIRRIKTDERQTEFLLFNKEKTIKNHGLDWSFYLYMQLFHFWRGLSLKGAFEYYKHFTDRFIPIAENISTVVVNSSASLNEWNMHHAIFQLNYDFTRPLKGFCPQISLFFKLPITGQRVINPYTFGGQLAINF